MAFVEQPTKALQDMYSWELFKVSFLCVPTYFLLIQHFIQGFIQLLLLCVQSMLWYGAVYICFGQFCWLNALAKCSASVIRFCFMICVIRFFFFFLTPSNFLTRSLGNSALFPLNLVWSTIILRVGPTNQEFVGASFIMASIASGIAEKRHARQAEERRLKSGLDASVGRQRSRSQAFSEVNDFSHFIEIHDDDTENALRKTEGLGRLETPFIDVFDVDFEEQSYSASRITEAAAKSRSTSVFGSSRSISVFKESIALQGRCI